ncbi:hypothetical protein [Maribellus sediminis]|uniref:hypothetical protein n=1 Tax=Maribellus sediminis TaxID=2696285 RepID=UPI00142FCA1D|nr:hypothetical protein [Maribellus sediminis]
MKRLITIALLISAISLFFGCSKDKESYTEYPVPNWEIQSPELYPNSFTAVVALPENIDAYAGESDLVAAFIGEECRAVGNLVETETDDGIKRVWYLTVRASDTENQEIVFRYYNSRLSYMYEATQRIAFEIDGTYGTYDSPVILELEYL